VGPITEPRVRFRTREPPSQLYGGVPRVEPPHQEASRTAGKAGNSALAAAWP
jgi:hypothetical protein